MSSRCIITFVAPHSANNRSSHSTIASSCCVAPNSNQTCLDNTSCNRVLVCGPSSSASKTANDNSHCAVRAPPGIALSRWQTQGMPTKLLPNRYKRFCHRRLTSERCVTNCCNFNSCRCASPASCAFTRLRQSRRHHSRHSTRFPLACQNATCNRPPRIRANFAQVACCNFFCW